MTRMKAIETPNASTPLGHYVQAMQANGMIYVSGLLGIKPTDEKIVVGNFEDQVTTCLANLKAILESEGATLNDVVKVTIYVDDVEKWGAANEIYARTFGAHKPARAIVPTRALHHGFEIEIDAIALAGN